MTLVGVVCSTLQQCMDSLIKWNLNILKQRQEDVLWFLVYHLPSGVEDVIRWLEMESGMSNYLLILIYIFITKLFILSVNIALINNNQ